MSAGQRYTEGMENAEIQIVSAREIESERETAYLLKSETMRQRLWQRELQPVTI